MLRNLIARVSPDGPGLLPRAIGAGLVVAVVSAAFAVLETAGAFPFSSTDDGPIYFVPLIKAHTDAMLGGNPFPYFWNLGAGWSPWETGQLGPLYPPYYICNLIARMLGEPLLLLEVSAWLHVALAGAIAFWLLPLRFRFPERMLLAILLALQPAPLILGANWHDYISPYPWLIGLLLLLLDVSEDDRWTSGRKAALLVFSMLYFIAAHPQMYVIGMGLLLVWRVALSRERSRLLRDAGLVVLCQLPALAPVLFLFLRSQEATADWMAFRENPDFLLEGAQSFGVWLHGVFLGNLVKNSGFFVLWSNTSWTGIGVFFAPWLLVSLYSSWIRRDVAWPIVAALLVLVMAAASFPFVKHLAIGPFAGFRWTWKLAFFFGPLSLVTILRLRQPQGTLRWLTLSGLVIAISASVWVAWCGFSFNLLPALRDGQPDGILTLVDETRDMMKKTGMRPGDRLALVGGFPIIKEKLPLPIVGLIGNAPLLSGLESAHFYEPLESATVAKAHFNLSTPWRIRIAAARYRAERERIEEGLRANGVRWLVAVHSHVFEEGIDSVRVHMDRYGRKTYVKMIGRSGAGFPWAVSAGKQVPLVVDDAGWVETRGAMAAPPDIAVGRRVDWYAVEGGRWRGVVHVVHVGWVAVTAILLLAAILGIRRIRWGG